MNTLICLTKTYSLGDFDIWLSYHLLHFNRIVILDNESEVDIKQVCDEHEQVEYHLIKGWPDQWHLFSDILNEKTDIKFEQDEIVTFLDDDEYLLVTKPTEKNKIEDISPEDTDNIMRHQFHCLDCALMPEILMVSSVPRDNRSCLLPFSSIYAVKQLSSQGKAFIRWQPGFEYDFCKEGPEIGHVPWINGIRMSDVVGSGVSKTTYGLQKLPNKDDNGCRVFLLHYHIKSIAEWEKKIKRGSAASKNEPGHNGSYDDDIRKDPKYPWNKSWFSKTENLQYMPRLYMLLSELIKKLYRITPGFPRDDLSNFQSVALPLIRRVYPSLLSMQTVGVIPIQNPASTASYRNLIQQTQTALNKNPWKTVLPTNGKNNQKLTCCQFTKKK